MEAAVRRAVRVRAGNRCEYCLLPQSSVDATFHIENVIPVQHGGTDDLDNLALACDRCNLFKGPNLSAVDQTTGQITNLFHPRRDRWDDHFELSQMVIAGKTPSGRATAALLQMNASHRRHLRAILISNGEF